MNPKHIIFSGTSMAPFLKAGDRLQIRRTLWSKLRIGDLVAVESSSSKHPIIHRLVGWRCRSNIRFGILKGDSLTQTDGFLLTKHNYLGRVWVRERNGKRLFLNSLYETMRARFMALFSILNLTPGVLRLKIKRELERLSPRIPGIKLLERYLLEKARYFVFSGQGDTKRLRVVYRSITMGEIVFQDNPFRVVSSIVFSIFSAVISPEELVSNATVKSSSFIKILRENEEPEK